MRVSRSRASSRRFARYAARARASSSANDDASEDGNDGDGRFAEAVASPAGMSRLDEHAVAARTAASRRRAARAGAAAGGRWWVEIGRGRGRRVPRGGRAAGVSSIAEAPRRRHVASAGARSGRARGRGRVAPRRGGGRGRGRAPGDARRRRGAHRARRVGNRDAGGGGCDTGGLRTARPWDAARASRAETGKKIDARRERQQLLQRSARLKSPSWLELGFPATLAASAHCAPPRRRRVPRPRDRGRDVRREGWVRLPSDPPALGAPAPVRVARVRSNSPDAPPRAPPRASDAPLTTPPPASPPHPRAFAGPRASAPCTRRPPSHTRSSRV